MKQYSDFELVDFLTDDAFVDWATKKSTVNHAFWSNWPTRYPLKAEVYYQAIELVSNIRVNNVEGLSEADITEIASQVNARISKEASKVAILKAKKWHQQSWIRTAAAVVLLCTVGFFFKNRSQTIGLSSAAASSPKARVENTPGVIRLADNSTVILKPGSKLTYASNFNQEARVVQLEGEAFFEVTKDASKPFIVKTRDLVTKVLGTSFSIKAYSADTDVKVTVNTGKVSVFKKASVSEKQLLSKQLDDNKGLGVLITPNQQVTFQKNELKLIKAHLPAPGPLSEEVTEMKFRFVDTPFSEVVKELSKAYGIKIIYNEQNMANCPLTAYLSKQHLYDKLDLICQAVEAKYEIVNGAIIINGKGCN